MIRTELLEVLRNWNQNQALLRNKKKEAIKRNEIFRLKNKVGSKDPVYLANKVKVRHNENPTVKLIVERLPELIHKALILDKKDYLVKGSVGNGRISDIPWIAIYHKSVTTTATKGYYPVFLFNDDCSGIHLSFLLGWTQYEQAYENATLSREKIRTSSSLLRQHLRSTKGFATSDINLKAAKSNSRAKGYELGTIFSKYYDLQAFPSESEILSDLRDILSLYTEMRGIVGNDFLLENTVFDEEHYQYLSDQVEELPELSDGPLPIKESYEYQSKHSYRRDATINAAAKAKANYSCEINPNHKTFISDSNGQNFVEGHHLIPVENQDRFDFSLDVPENIVALCPNCHRAIHNATEEVRNNMIKQLFSNRKESLKLRGLILEVQELIQFY